MKRISEILFVLFVMQVCLSPAVAQNDPFAAGPPPKNAVKERPLLIKFYDITPLVTERQHYAFHDGTAALEYSRIGVNAGMPGGMGGGGGAMGGGGAGGGQGFFCVPSAPQFGGGGMGGMGGADVSGVGDSNSEPSLQEWLEMQGDSIEELIENSVDPDSWESMGGPGTIRDLGNTLMIRQTEEVHAEITTFLRELSIAVVGKGTYQLEAWWIPVVEETASGLQEILADQSDANVSCQKLTSLSQEWGGYHAMMLCREHVTTHAVSGSQVPIVVGSTPVVGTGNASDQPIVRTLLLGLLMEAKISSVPEYSTSSAEMEAGDQLNLSFRSMVSNSDANIQDFGAGGGKIDRYSLGKHVSEGTCTVRQDRLTRIASLSQLSTNQSGQPPEMQLIVRITLHGG